MTEEFIAEECRAAGTKVVSIHSSRKDAETMMVKVRALFPDEEVCRACMNQIVFKNHSYVSFVDLRAETMCGVRGEIVFIPQSMLNHETYTSVVLPMMCVARRRLAETQKKFLYVY